MPSSPDQPPDNVVSLDLERIKREYASDSTAALSDLLDELEADANAAARHDGYEKHVGLVGEHATRIAIELLRRAGLLDETEPVVPPETPDGAA